MSTPRASTPTAGSDTAPSSSDDADVGVGGLALVIDNWDSFTGNVCGLIHAVTGVPPLLVRNTITPVQIDLLISQRRPDFIVCGPGPGNPTHTGDFGVNVHVLSSVRLPVLGICLGMQGIAAHHGAVISRVPDPRHGFPRPVYHAGTHPLFRDIPSPFTAVCYNSLCAQGGGVQAIAWTGDGVVMAVEAPQAQIGVQFHPESHLTDCAHRLIRNFLVHYVPSRSGPWSAPPPTMNQNRPALPRDRRRMQLMYSSVSCPSEFSVEALFRRLRSISPTSDCFWLDSADGGDFSYLSVNVGHHIRYDLQRRHVADSGDRHRTLTASETFFDYLQARVSSYSLTDDAKQASDALPFDFVGGYVGYLSYEMKAECTAGGTSFPNSNGSCPDYHAAAFAFVDQFVAIDHRHNTAYAVVLSESETRTDTTDWFSNITSIVRECTVAETEIKSPPDPTTGAFSCRDTKETYQRHVAACLEYIADGQSYELCLTTQHVSAMTIADPFALYVDLRRSNPAPFGAFIQFDDVAVCSCSPERFVRVGKRLQVSSQPIKGTARRGSSDSDDRLLQVQLENSLKDRAENLMITDLVRHDLAQCCVPGSVTVAQFCELQRFRHVFQLTSTVVGQLAPHSSPLDCIQAAFPPGSMTGAPKKRSVEILEGIERMPRGIYSGSLGFLSVNGAADFNVVIRTVICARTSTTIGSGGAIVSLSNADAEYDEMLLKAQAPIRFTSRHLSSL